ncbi:MAG: DUF4157 domain-containing protein [Dehalococcoidia bacterium]
MNGPDFDRDRLTRTQQAQAAVDAPVEADPRTSRNLASSLGNAGMQRLMRSAHLQRSGDGSGPVDDDIARSIQAKRGTGASLDNATRADLEPALGSDFGDVRVHTDGEADALNRAVSAEAFTTGKDIFFRSGNYNPGSADGRKLLAHELTHVVQQRSAPAQSDLSVSSPSDSSELEASAVADSLDHAPAASPSPVARAEVPEEEEQVATSPLAREDVPEEEEQVAMTPLAREDVPEEEEQVAMTPLAREDVPEEEEEVAMTPLAREEAPEEEVPA